MGEPDVADAYRVTPGRHWALPFLTALVVSAPLRPAQRSPAPDVHRLRPADAGLPAPVAAGPGPGGGGRWRLRQARVPAALPEYVKADCRRHQTAQGRVPVPARATAAARPDRAAPGGRRAIAQSHGGAGRSRYTMDSLPRHRFRRQYRHGQLASGVALWTTAGSRRFTCVGSSSDTWRSAAGPMLCYAPTPRRNRCGYCSGICCGGRSR